MGILWRNVVDINFGEIRTERFGYVNGIGRSGGMGFEIFPIFLVGLASDGAVILTVYSLLKELVVGQIQLPVASFILT